MGARISTHAPVELIVHALLYLQPDDIRSISRTNRYLRDSVLSSPTLQYHVLLLESGCIDIRNAGTRRESITERISALSRYRKLGRDCSFLEISTSSHHLTALRSPPYHYTRRLQQGLYVLHHDDRYTRGPEDSNILYVSELALPDNHGGDRALLVNTRVVECNSKITGFSYDRYGQDLLALVTLDTTTGNHPSLHYTVSLHLRLLSTNSSHPHASQPTLPIFEGSTHVLDDPLLNDMQATVEICGTTVLILLNWRFQWSRQLKTTYNRIILVDWTSGDILAHDAAARGTWTSFTYLTREIIVLTNKHTETLDIVRLPSLPPVDSNEGANADQKIEGTTPRFTKLLSLHLPRRTCDTGHGLDGFKVTASPSIVYDKLQGHGLHPYHPAFTASADAALIEVSFLAEGSPQSDRWIGVSLVSHRSAILDVLASHTDMDNPPSPGPICSLLSKAWRPRVLPRLSGPDVVEWTEWSPHTTRLIKQNVDDLTHEIGVFGQRLIWFDVATKQIVISDFNHYELRHVEKELSASADTDAPTSVKSKGGVTRKIVHQSAVIPGLRYEEQIVSDLPYVETRIDADPDMSYGHFWLDEDFVLCEPYERIDGWIRFSGKMEVSVQRL